MPRPQQLGEMSAVNSEALIQEIELHKDEFGGNRFKPRTTFPFPISKEKHDLLDSVAVDGPIDLNLFDKFLKSRDVVERGIAYHLAPLLDGTSLTTEQIRLIISAHSGYPKEPILPLSEDPFPKFSEVQIPVLMEILIQDRSTAKPVIQILGNIGQPALPALRQIAEWKREPNWGNLVRAFGRCGNEAFEDLKYIYESKLCGSFDTAVALVHSGEEGTQFLIKELEQKKNEWLYLDIFHHFIATEIGPISLFKHFISDSVHKDRGLQQSIIYALPRYGVEGLRLVGEELDRFTAEAKFDLVMVIGANFNQDGSAILEKLSKDKDGRVSSIAETTLKRTQSMVASASNLQENATAPKESWKPEIAGSAKAIFATPEARRAARALDTLKHIVKNLITVSKSPLVGLVIFGSLSKGYLSKKSDIDYGVITQGEDPTKEIDKHLEMWGLKPCTGGRYVLNSNINKGFLDRLGLLSIAFYGLFIGDEKKLAETQVAILESTHPTTWDEIRSRIFREEADIEKAGERYELTKREIEKTKLAALITRIPPDHKTSLELARKRLRTALKKF